MAVHFKTTSAKSLLNSFDARIKQAEQIGKITTWEKDEDGDYTHKSAEWKNKAWFRPKIENDQLTFHIIRQQDVDMTIIVYGYYHGHIVETFLNHFDDAFEYAIASARAEAGDNIQ
jgi:hypothetical protein